MSYKLVITEKPSYLHALVTGANTKENVQGYLQDVLRECVARNATQLLIEERLDGPRLDVLDVFSVAAEQSAPARGVFKGIAYVDVNASGDLMKFAETVAVNRGLPVKVFSTVSDAEKWLLKL